MKMKKLIIPIIGIIIAIPFLLFFSLFYGTRTIKFGLARYDGVPPEASNIDYFKLNDTATGLTTLDFTISEDNFKEFAKSKGWQLKEIDLPQLIQNTSFFAGKQKGGVIVKKGLKYSKIKSNGGGITVIYDREKKRAHIFTCNR